MTRADFTECLRGELRMLLMKHERERAAVKERDAFAQCAPVFTDERSLMASLEREVANAGQQLDMAITVVADRLYDVAKGEGAE